MIPKVVPGIRRSEAKMLQMEPGPERARLGFAEAVQLSFRFLEKQGFECARADPTFVRYESDQAFVNVYHGRSSYELSVEIGRLGNEWETDAEGSELVEPHVGHPYLEDSFTIWDIARYAGAPDVAETTFMQARSPDRVEALVPKLAELVQLYAKLALKGDVAFLERVRQWRSEESRRSRKRDELRRARAEMAQAWRKKQYVRVVALLEPFRSDLTPAEIKKLNYAEEQLKN